MFCAHMPLESDPAYRGICIHSHADTVSKLGCECSSSDFPPCFQKVSSVEVRIGSNLVELDGKLFLTLGRNRSKFGRAPSHSLPKSGRVWSIPGRTLSIPGQHSPKFVEFGPNLVDFGLNLARAMARLWNTSACIPRIRAARSHARPTDRPSSVPFLHRARSQALHVWRRQAPL